MLVDWGWFGPLLGDIINILSIILKVIVPAISTDPVVAPLKPSKLYSPVHKLQMLKRLHTNIMPNFRYS